jgi:transcriptional regulator with XRE-family HTH domain
VSRSARGAERLNFLRALGGAFHAARKELHLLQGQLGARGGLQGVRVGEIERGEVDSGITRFWSLAQALGVPLWELVRRAEEHDEAAASARRAEIESALHELGLRDLTLVASLVRRLRS